MKDKVSQQQNLFYYISKENEQFQRHVSRMEEHSKNLPMRPSWIKEMKDQIRRLDALIVQLEKL